MENLNREFTVGPGLKSFLRQLNHLTFLRFALVLLLSTLLYNCASPLRANRGSVTEFKVGQLDPKDVDTGTLVGLSIGNSIDEHLYWGFEGNYFWSSFAQTTTVADTISTKELELDFSTTFLSLFVNFTYEYRFGRSKWYYRASAGGGWEFMWSRERNFIEDKSRRRRFNSPAYQLTTGLGLRISNNGIFFADLIYNYAVGKTDQTPNETGLPTFEQIDVSGFGFRAGLNIYNFKIF
jgi:hypothetical protein